MFACRRQDTLWDTWSVLTAAHVEKQRYIEVHYPKIAARWDLEACRAHNIEVRKARPDLAHSFTAAHREAIRLQAAAVGYDPQQATDDIFAAFLAARNNVQMYAATAAILLLLRAPAAQFSCGADGGCRGVVLSTIRLECRLSR